MNIDIGPAVKDDIQMQYNDTYLDNMCLLKITLKGKYTVRFMAVDDGLMASVENVNEMQGCIDLLKNLISIYVNNVLISFKTDIAIDKYDNDIIFHPLQLEE